MFGKLLCTAAAAAFCLFCVFANHLLAFPFPSADLVPSPPLRFLPAAARAAGTAAAAAAVGVATGAAAAPAAAAPAAGTAPTGTGGGTITTLVPQKSELTLLCERFQQQFGHLQPDGSPTLLMLNDVAEVLGVPRRRLYDVINVFESIEVGGLSLPGLGWVGRGGRLGVRVLVGGTVEGGGLGGEEEGWQKHYFPAQQPLVVPAASPCQLQWQGGYDSPGLQDPCTSYPEDSLLAPTPWPLQTLAPFLKPSTCPLHSAHPVSPFCELSFPPPDASPPLLTCPALPCRSCAAWAS